MHKNRSVLDQQWRDASDTTIDKRLDHLILQLICLDDEHRRDAVTRILAVALPAGRVLILDRLVELLKSRDKKSPLSAAKSLAEMGDVALPALRHALASAGDSTFKVRVAEVLGTIGAKSSSANQMGLQMAFMIALSRTRNRRVVAAIRKALDQIGPGVDGRDSH